MTQVKQRKGSRMSCDVSKATEGLENEFWRRWNSAHSPTFPSLLLGYNSLSNPSVALPMSQLILQPFRCFTYVAVHSPTLLSLLLRHKVCSFPNFSITSPTSQLIIQPFRRFTYVTAHSPTLLLLHLCRSSFSNPYFASTTSQSSSLNSSSELPMIENQWSELHLWRKEICMLRSQAACLVECIQ